MSLKQVRTLALAATVLAGTTALAYAQSSHSSMGTGGRHESGAASTMAAGGASASSGEMNKDEHGKSSSIKNGEAGKSSAVKSAVKKEFGKDVSNTGEPGQRGMSKNAESGKSSTAGTGNSSSESGKNGTAANSENSTMGKPGQSGTNDKGANASSASSSSANAGASVNLTNQQKTAIKSIVINNKSAPHVTHVNFNVSVGTVVPTTVHYAPLPERIIEIHPAWRGYDYFVYNDEGHHHPAAHAQDRRDHRPS